MLEEMKLHSCFQQFFMVNICLLFFEIGMTVMVSYHASDPWPNDIHPKVLTNNPYLQLQLNILRRMIQINKPMKG